MARIVALSSFVARGHVGLRAMCPALEWKGHDVVALPTVVLSSHAAFPQVAGTPIDPGILEQMIGALDANGWLAAVDMVITGYLPSQAHVEVASRLVDRVRDRSPAMTYVCDPVLGDEPKGLYVPLAMAGRLRDDLLPRAAVTTPNVFELAWLTGRPVTSIETAVQAARALGSPGVLATSVPGTAGEVATLYCDRETSLHTAVPRRSRVPSGTGDLLTGLFAAHRACGDSVSGALASAGAWLEAVLAASRDTGDLDLAPLYGPTPRPLPIIFGRNT